MSIFLWIFLFIIAAFTFYFIIPFLKQRRAHQELGYLHLNKETRYLVDNKKVDKLAQILFQLDLDILENERCNQESKNSELYFVSARILDAIGYNGFSLTLKVDKKRNQLRKKGGLPPLRGLF